MCYYYDLFLFCFFVCLFFKIIVKIGFFQILFKIFTKKIGSNVSSLHFVDSSSSTPSFNFNVSVGTVYWYISASNGYLSSSSSLSQFYFKTCIDKVPDVRKQFFLIFFLNLLFLFLNNFSI